jgi:hypothetical protein
MGSPIPLSELAGFLKTLGELKDMVGGLVEDKRKGAAGEGLAEQGKRCVLKMAEVRRANRDAHEAADRLVTAAEAERHATDVVSQQVLKSQIARGWRATRCPF